MSRFVTNTTHPLIENANEFMLFKKYVSIHSEDRDVIKYPNSGYFELDLPQDYLNVSTVTLSNYTFPMYYNVFSISQNNVFFTFSLASYNPILPIPASLSLAINNTEFTIIITEGTYTSTTMPTELTNKMNEAVNIYLLAYMAQNSIDTTAFIAAGGYTGFVVVFNSVSQTLWFGNTSSAFVITNESPLYRSETLQLNVLLPEAVQTFINWGLPAYLGFFQSNAYSRTSKIPPRFYYGDVVSGDNGYWLAPATSTSDVYFLEAPRKLNIVGESYFYMDVQLLNTMDELAPFSSHNIKRETSTNQSNGINNSAFAKIPVDPAGQQGAQWFNSSAYKLFYPPAERIRKLRIKLRFHDGRLVNFDNFNYSFSLIFTILIPHTLRNATCIDPTLSQGFNNSFGNKLS